MSCVNWLAKNVKNAPPQKKVSGSVRGKHDVEVAGKKLASGCLIHLAPLHKNSTLVKFTVTMGMEMERQIAERKDMKKADKTQADWRKMGKNLEKSCARKRGQAGNSCEVNLASS